MVGHVELVPRDRVGEVVVDDAVGGGVEASDDGVVVGECERGEDGDQALGGGGAIGKEAADVREGGLELVPEAEAVRGYEQHHRLMEPGERPRGGGGRLHGRVEGRADDEEEEGFTCIPLQKMAPTSIPLKSLVTPLYHRVFSF